jgi:hypothetical protein
MIRRTSLVSEEHTSGPASGGRLVTRVLPEAWHLAQAEGMTAKRMTLCE